MRRVKGQATAAGPAVDQQVVIHLYAVTDGPDAPAAYRAVRDLWLGCRHVFGMRDPIRGTGLPQHLPNDRAGLPAESVTGPQAALAGQELPSADCQAVLRRHYDLLNLSVVLAPPQTAAAREPGRSWWRELDQQWSALVARYEAHILGEARLYLAKVSGASRGDGRALAPASVRQWLSGLLPAGADPGQWWDRDVTFAGRVTLWEASQQADDRALRRFVLAFAEEYDALASGWIWSRGDAAIPPLARYLLHAAKLRYQLKVWQRDDRTRELRATIDSIVAELRRLRGAGPPDVVAREAELLRSPRLDALLMTADLRELRRAVEVAADNMERAIAAPELLAEGGPFAQDAALARWFIDRLDDQVGGLEVSADRASRLTAEPAALRPADQPATTTGPADDVTRNVFVAYGKDEAARFAVFEFLRALDLRPLEWEQLVAGTGKAAPPLTEVLSQAMTRTQAAVVLLTPDDVVALHPDLRGGASDAARYELQARPNVLVELGMALATYPERTIILVAGDQRPISDLAGLSYVRLTGSAQCHLQIALRLKLAGCRVNDHGQDWLAPARFADLAAYYRTVSAP